MRKLSLSSALLLGGLAAAPTLVACGGASSARIVDTPSGSAVTYGAPRDTSYEVEVEPARDDMVVHVYERSKCSIIPVRLVQRQRQILNGEEVVQREDLGKVQVAEAPQGEVTCDQTFARNLEVSLVVGGGVHPLGRTDKLGTVRANLSQLLQSAGYGENPPDEAIVRIRPHEARPALDGRKISLRELNQHEARVSAMLTELEGILAKGETGASGAEIARSYELYEQLSDVAPSDPRVRGLSARFWELLYGRKQEEARDKMGKNLQALDQARELLKNAGDAAIPFYVQAAVNSGLLDERSLEWASLRLIRALRAETVVCRQGFDFARLPSYGWPVDVTVAGRYAQFGYGDDYARNLTTACTRF